MIRSAPTLSRRDTLALLLAVGPALALRPRTWHRLHPAPGPIRVVPLPRHLGEATLAG